MNILKIFESVRDMPLKFPDNGKEDDFTCWGKHRILKSLLDSSDFETRCRICEFLWSEQKIPKRILGIPHYDKDYHLFLEVKINNNWIQKPDVLNFS